MLDTFIFKLFGITIKSCSPSSKLPNFKKYRSIFTYLSHNPTAGDVIPNADGARKLRWAAKGKGTRGGARVIYFSMMAQGAILMIAAYAKSEQENMDSKDIRKAGQYEL